MKITLLVDNLKSWYYPHMQELKKKLEKDGNKVYLLNAKEDMAGYMQGLECINKRYI